MIEKKSDREKPDREKELCRKLVRERQREKINARKSYIENSDREKE